MLDKLIKKPSYLFWAFFVSYLILWTLTPTLMRFVLPMDATEGAMWSRSLQWGYPRDPWVNALLTKIALLVSFDHDWGLYLFSQLMVLLSMWSIWRLAKIILKNIYLAIVAPILLVVIQYYNIGVIDFNDNTCLLGLWSVTILYYYRSITTNRLKYWIFLGFLAGLAMMAKYYTAILLISMLCFIVFERSNYKIFKEYKIYLSLIIVFIISIPHTIWLFKYDFVPVQFSLSVLNRDQDITSYVTKHFFYGLRFFIIQIVTFSSAVLLFLFGFFGKNKLALNKIEFVRSYDLKFLIFIGCLPFIFTVLISMVTGWHIYTMWGIPLLNLWSIILIAIFKPILTKAKLLRIITLAYIITIIFILGYILSMIRSKTSSGNYPTKEIATVVSDFWHQKYNKKLKYIIGYNRPVSYMVRYTENTQGIIDFNPKLNPAISMNDVEKNGAVFIFIPQMEGNDMPPKKFIENYPQLVMMPYQKISWKRMKPNQKPMYFRLGYLPPQED